MKKQKIRIFGKDNYLLGVDGDGTKYFLQAAQWDCDWYWGGGYVETYTNNRNPEKSRDIQSHQHFDGLFFRGNKNGYDNFNEFFIETPFTDGEKWKIIELMRAFYTCREYSDTIHRGGAHYTQNPVADVIKNDVEYKRINEVVIPAIMAALYEILGGGDNER